MSGNEMGRSDKIGLVVCFSVVGRGRRIFGIFGIFGCL
jgi:hypothetical protein